MRLQFGHQIQPVIQSCNTSNRMVGYMQKDTLGSLTSKSSPVVHWAILGSCWTFLWFQKESHFPAAVDVLCPNVQWKGLVNFTDLWSATKCADYTLDMFYGSTVRFSSGLLLQILVLVANQPVR